MKPKKKANELIERYMQDAMHYVTNVRLRSKAAKQCALIAVDEIITNTQSLDELYPHKGIGGDTVYWQEVKKEIEIA